MSSSATRRTYSDQVTTAPDQVTVADAKEEQRRQALAAMAAKAAKDLADAPAHEVIRWAVSTFAERVCITSSMTDAVIIHLAATVKPGIDVIFLDTGYHFPETIGTRDAVAAVYPINLINVTPSRTVAEQDAELAPPLRAEPRPVLLPAQGGPAGAGAGPL